MKIYTKTGDQGSTSLLTGKRVAKNDARIDAYGTVDELNSWIGLLSTFPVNEPQADVLKNIQDRLFNMGSSLAAGDPNVFSTDVETSDISILEAQMDEFDQILPPLRHFVLPGGSAEVAYVHIARTVCRRAERMVVTLHQDSQVEPIIIQYLNRLSDYLFVLSRWIAFSQKVEEVKWIPRKKQD
jgi:cob(I)alamin adenosyltransferase